MGPFRGGCGATAHELLWAAALRLDPETAQREELLLGPDGWSCKERHFFGMIVGQFVLMLSCAFGPGLPAWMVDRFTVVGAGYTRINVKRRLPTLTVLPFPPH